MKILDDEEFTAKLRRALRDAELKRLGAKFIVTGCGLDDGKYCQRSDCFDFSHLREFSAPLCVLCGFAVNPFGSW